MMRFLRFISPRFAGGGALLAGLPDRDDITAEGRYVAVQWLGVIVEITVAKVKK